MNGKLFGIGLAVLAIVAGGLMYWLQVYAYYDEVTLAPGDLSLVDRTTGEAVALPFADARAIDADSSPIRFRACFTTTLTAEDMAAFEPYEGAEPRVAPFWFDCFDAEAVGDAIDAGEAQAWLGQANIDYGVDRVVAIFPDGRGYAWHQPNNCGELAYDGTPVGPACPERTD